MVPTKKVMSMALALLLAVALIPFTSYSAFADEANTLGSQDVLETVLDGCEIDETGTTDEANEAEDSSLDPLDPFEPDDDFSGIDEDALGKEEENDLEAKDDLKLQEPVDGDGLTEEDDPSTEDKGDELKTDASSELDPLSSPTFIPDASANEYNALRYLISIPSSKQFVIRITQSFVLRDAIDIPPGKNIVIMSDRNHTLTTNGSSGHFNVRGTLTMSGSLTLTESSYGSGGVRISKGGTFTMYGGSITGNTAGVHSFGGVLVEEGGSFVMRGGTISKNTTVEGAGVRIVGRGSFVMYGGSITNNSAKGVASNNQSDPGGCGGGVGMSGGGTFTMHGGTISTNTSDGAGAGVYITDSAFTMHGGTIRDNASSSTRSNLGDGGGVVVLGDSAKFTFNGGTISGNSATRIGGGLFVSNAATSIMNGGTIKENTAIIQGGGVHVGNSSSFTLKNGTISSNRSAAIGGGVYSRGTFIIEGGTITNNRAETGGGGIFSRTTVTLNGGTITNNRAGTDGGGIYLREESTTSFTMNAGTIKDNVAKGNGGAIYCRNKRYIKKISNTSIFSGNKAARTVDYGIIYRGDRGAYPQISWAGSNSIRGSHLLNNYDVSFVPIKPAITTDLLVDAIVGQLYSQSLVATGTNEIIWSYVSGSLPPGIKLSSNGVMSGKPTRAGTYTFRLKANNAAGSAEKSFRIVVREKPKITTSATLQSGTVGLAYKKTLAASGTKAITWKRISGSLPPGLKLSSAGIISGKPTKPGAYSFKVRAQNSFGATTKTFKITIEQTAKERPILALSYATHVQNLGWQPFRAEGEMSGTQGRALRLEGIKINL
ncbi:MAG: putative Ig domain-containing protein, partial [Coriobacteriia bacterium]|nr:putative Ig domain-containing protein [Coriobacteriia bacterium]